MNVIDVYDIANSTWYKQSTSGKSPSIRVNPCAVAASAADGSSTQVYLYGGQNLIPYGQQKQYEDMWILTIPGFIWIEVDTNEQSVPPARAGHTCNIWNSQLVVVGGYVGQDLSCDSPGIYVFDASELKWQTKYAALEGSNDLNRQDSQKDGKGGLSGSYGYRVPKAVQSVIGGDELGKATITAPAIDPTGGPIATGKPITYTLPPGAPTGRPGDPNHGSGGGGPNVAAIVAGVIAGCLAVLAAYLGFCTYVYRKQLALYKQHVAAAQRSSDGSHYGNKMSYGWPKEDMSVNDRSVGESSGGATAGMTPAAAAAHAFAASEYARSASGRPGSASASSSTEDLLGGQEPTFLGVMLNPRRSLRVINKD